MSKFSKEADRIAAGVLSEKFEKRLETIGIDQGLDELNLFWRAEVRGDARAQYRLNRLSKNESPRNPAEQKKIDRELKKFEDLLLAGGIDQALSQLNKMWRRETRGKRKRALY